MGKNEIAIKMYEIINDIKCYECPLYFVCMELRDTNVCEVLKNEAL